MLELFDKLDCFGLGGVVIKKMNIKVYDSNVEKKAAAKNRSPELEAYMMKRKFNCPVCSCDFESSYVRSSKTRLKRLDTDLKPIYEPVDPLYYDATVCPECGYAALGATFSSLLDKQADEIKKRITPNYKPKEYSLIHTASDAIERYQLALLNSVIKKGKDSEKAFICLKTAWIYRDENNTEKETLFLQSAVSGFVSAYENEEFPICGMDNPTLTYLIGELYRRLGNYEKAIYFISRVIGMHGANQRILDRAQDARELIKKARAAQE